MKLTWILFIFTEDNNILLIVTKKGQQKFTRLIKHCLHSEDNYLANKIQLFNKNL